MNESSGKKEKPSRGKARLDYLRNVSEEEIMRTSPPELADIPDDLWANAKVLPPVNKTAISLRIDDDVLEWFRSLGPRYQSRMNAVLRSYMEHTRKRGRKGRT